MAGAALSQSHAHSAPDAALNLYLRAVWSRLATGAFVAAVCAWLVAMLPPLRASILIEYGAASIGLTLVGVALAASVSLIWVGARLFARGPNLLNPVWFWFFCATAGAAGNALALLFLRESVVSMFALAAAGMAAVHIAHRFVRQLPSWASAILFAATGSGGEWMADSLLHRAWPYIAIDLAALAVLALLIAARADAFPAIQQSLSRPSPKAGVTYAAMHLIALADAPSAKITSEEEA